jgi:hypothetical protein
MKTWKRMRSCLLLAVLAVVVCLGFSYVVLSSAVSRLPDYGKLPPGQVFTQVLGYAPPSGITHLQAEGRQSLYGPTTLWLSFDFTNAALAAMLAENPGRALSPFEATETVRQESRPYSRRTAERMRRTGWDAVGKIVQPEVRALPTNRTKFSGWGGWLIIDRAGKRAYIKARSFTELRR